MEFLLELLVWPVLQLVFAPFERRGPWVEAVGFGVLGLLVGAASLWVRPARVVADPALATGLLVAAPVAMGLALAAVGWAVPRRGRRELRLDTFGCGALFALGVAAVRWGFAA